MSQESLPLRPVSATPYEVICVAAPEDAELLHELETHLSLLVRQGVISVWHERLVTPGTNWAAAIETHLEQASVILLLVSSDFFASDSASGVELDRVLQRQEANAACVIPIIVRPCNWQNASFAYLQCLPRGGKPVTRWPNRDLAWTQVVRELQQILGELPVFSAPLSHATFPSVWNIPFPRNPFFVGRDDLVERLRTSLLAGQATALSQTQAISGLGGVGKTHIAVEYAYRFRQQYQVVWWARAESQETLVASFTELAVMLRLPEREIQEQNQIITAVKIWLQRHSGWLLLLDNADNLDLLPTFLPPFSGGHLILTTRAWDMQGLATRLEVDSLPTNVGALFLLRRAGRLALDASLEQADPRERELACQIVEQVGGLPLALDQAGAYLGTTGMDLEVYQQGYQRHRRALHQRRGSLAPDHPDPVATTWKLAFTRVESLDPAAAELLQMCAFLSADAIPEEMLEQGGAYLGSVLSPVVADPFLLGEAIAVLRTYSLIQRDPQKQTFSVHRLVQAVVADDLDEVTCRLWKERILHLLLSALSPVEFASWSAWERLLGHIMLAVSWEEECLASEVAKLFRLTGWYLSGRVRYREAEPLLRKALEYEQRERGEEHADTASAYHALAFLYRAQGKYTQAEDLYGRALRIYEQTLGAEHLSIATTLHEQARLAQAQGKYEQAERPYVRALRVYERVLGGEHPSTAATLHEQARLAQAQGKYEQAERLYRRALGIYEQALGARHPDTATTLHNLASLAQAQGKYEQAERLYGRALGIYGQALGIGHPDTATTLHNLASLAQAQGKYEQAERSYGQALGIYEQALGAGHPDTATTLHNLARLAQAQGKYEQAERLYGRALWIKEQALGTEHPSIAATLHELARLAQVQGKYEQAEGLYGQALHIKEQALGTEHPSTATTLHELASLSREQGKYGQAERLYRRALHIKEQALGTEHPSTATTLHNLASLSQAQGRYEQAEGLYRRALQISEQTLAAGHPSIAATLHELASLAQAQGKYGQAEGLYGRALRIYEQALGGEHPSIAATLHEQARLAQEQGKYEQAGGLYIWALEIYERMLGAGHPSVGTTLHNMASLAQEQGKYEQAERLYRRALQIYEQALEVEHPSIATTLHNMASLARAQGKYEQAEELYERALWIYEQVLGVEHPSTAATLCNMASLAQEQEKYERAAVLYGRVLEIYEHALGGSHPDAALTRTCYISILKMMGQTEAAAQLENRGL